MDKDVLSKVVVNDTAGTASYLSAAEGKELAEKGYIEVNTAVSDPNDASKVLARATQAGRDFLAANQGTAGNGEAAKPHYAIMTGIALPELKRRGNPSGNGAPTKYPFADLPVNGVFFSGNSEHKKGDAVKALGSTVSAQNEKYSKQKMENGVGVTKTVTRAVRDKATKKAQIGPDGKKVTETVQLPVKEYERKFTIRPVPAGYKSGDWVAPEAGALVARTV
jgi:hypothetical protein